MKSGKDLEANSIPDYRIANLFRSILQLIDGKLTKEDNIQGKVIRGFFFEQPNFDYPLEHKLGRVVTDYIILNKNNFANFKLGNGSTSQRTYLQCDTANTTADVFFWG